MTILLSPPATVGEHVANASLSSAVALSDTNADGILVQAENKNVRYTISATTPTSALGFKLKADDPPLLIQLRFGKALNVIEESATATLQYQFVAGV